MQRFTITKGATSQIIPISVYDSSSTIGAKLAGLAFGTAGLVVYYNRIGSAGAATAITLVTATKGTWVTSGFIAVDGTNMLGDYELHLPDVVLASGVDRIIIQLQGATNMVPVNIEIDLIDVDVPQTADHTAAIADIPNNAEFNTKLPNNLNTTALGNIGVDFANVENPSTVVNLAGTTTKNVTDALTIGTNNDKTGYSIAGAKTTLDALNDIAASAIVTGGAIATTTGAVDSVTVVDTTTGVTNRVTANADQLGGQTVTAAAGVTIHTDVGVNATAQAALEDQFDGTGLTGDKYPATQAQVGNISTGSAALSKRAEAGVVNVGVVIGATDYTNTFTLNGLFHSITEDVPGNFNVEYTFDVGGSGVAVEVSMDGYFSGNGDVLGIEAYNYIGAVWEGIGSITATSGSVTGNSVFNLDIQHTGTSGADTGKVRIRGYEAGGGLSAVQLNMDRVFLSYSVVSETVGYALGRLWLNTVSGTSGTEKYVNGVADKPVSNIADILTLSGTAITGLTDVNISSNSTFAPVVDVNGYNLYGIGYTCTLGGRDFGGTHVFHAAPLTGKAITTSGFGHFDALDSIVGDVEVDDAHFTNCSFNGTITLDQITSGDLKIINSRSIIAGAVTPVIDCGVALVTHNISIADYQNGIEVRNLNNGGTNNFSISGTGQLIIAATCSGNLNVRGSWRVTNLAGGAVTINYDDVAQGVFDIIVDTNELQTDWTNGGRLDLILDELTSQGDTNEGLISALQDLSTTEVLTQVNAALDTAISELGVGSPTATPSLRTGLMLMYMMTRNRVDVDTSGVDAIKIHNNAGTQIASKLVTDDTVDYSEAGMS